MVTRNRDLSKRMNYFDRQFLRAQDFMDEQDHYTDRRWRHNRLLHVSGVAENLIVSGKKQRRFVFFEARLGAHQGSELRAFDIYLYIGRRRNLSFVQ